jgi:hypothetical protein
MKIYCTEGYACILFYVLENKQNFIFLQAHFLLLCNAYFIYFFCFYKNRTSTNL